MADMDHSPANGKIDLGALQQRVLNNETTIGEVEKNLSSQISSVAISIRDLAIKVDRQYNESVQAGKTNWTAIISTTISVFGFGLGLVYTYGAQQKAAIESTISSNFNTNAKEIANIAAALKDEAQAFVPKGEVLSLNKNISDQAQRNTQRIDDIYRDFQSKELAKEVALRLQEERDILNSERLREHDALAKQVDDMRNAGATKVDIQTLSERISTISTRLNNYLATLQVVPSLPALPGSSFATSPPRNKD